MGQAATSSNRNGRDGIHIDMTPMADLAFLLLTFFVLTMTINKKYVVQVQTPDTRDTFSTVPINVKRVLTIVLGRNNRIYYYQGDQTQVQLTDYSKEGIRDLLLRSNIMIDKLVVLIKPSQESKYKNLVDVLDEVDITQIPHYYIVKETDDDRNMIASANL